MIAVTYRAIAWNPSAGGKSKNSTTPESGAGALASVDPELRREVERLLAHDSESGGKLLDQQAADLIAPSGRTPIAAGARLGPYIINALLGQGGMGQIFRATDTRLGRSVAIKIAHEKFSDRFEQESRAIAALNHPNICTVHDVGPNYLVMELVDGDTLAARLKHGKLSMAQTIRFGSQIAEALAAAHAKGIIHRDLKPANIMLTKSEVKVLDFGLAKSPSDPNLMGPGAMMGTLMALPFDMKRLQAAGDAFPLAQGVVQGSNPYWMAATSNQGVLAYVSGQRGSWQYVWRDRQGKNLGAFGEAGGVVMISPDGKGLVGDSGESLSLWDFARGASTRLTFGPASGFNPIWSPDGRYVAYAKVGVGIFRKAANGAGSEELLLPVKALAVPKSWSPDGRFMLYAQINPGTGADLLGFPVVPDPKPFVVAQSPPLRTRGSFLPMENGWPTLRTSPAKARST